MIDLHVNRGAVTHMASYRRIICVCWASVELIACLEIHSSISKSTFIAKVTKELLLLMKVRQTSTHSKPLSNQAINGINI